MSIFKDLSDSLKNTLVSTVQDNINLGDITGTFNDVVSNVSTIAGNLNETAKNLKNTLKTTITDATQTLKGSLNTVSNNLKTSANDILENLKTNLTSGGIANILNGLTEGLNNGAEGLTDIIKNFDLNLPEDISNPADLLGTIISSSTSGLSLDLFSDVLKTNASSINTTGPSYLGTSTTASQYTSFATPYSRNKNKSLFGGKASKYKTLSEVTPRAITEFSEKWTLRLPDWGYDDFINERSMFQKQITTVLNDPAYFYFKVFFRFDTQNGLFGGLLNNENNTAKQSKNNGYAISNNSAAKYLYTCSGSYYNERIGDRILALKKFTSLLSYISSNAPWFFSDVKGLDKINISIPKNFSEEKSIEIGVLPDAIDMRLTTLMSLYKYACYDDINCKEIIPENIRKFDMSILVFQTPIRYLHTSTYSESNGSQKYKSVAERAGSSGNGINDNMMSFKLYSFTGCEFDLESFGSIVPSSMKNDMPFKTNETSIKITYTKCYEYTSNEFFGFLFGSDGFYYNQYSTFQQSITLNSGEKKPYTGFINSIDTQLYNQEKRYKALQDSLQDYSTGKTPGFNKLIDASEYLVHGFYDMGEDIWYKNADVVGNVYGELGNLYGDIGIGSEYWRSKIRNIKRQRPHDYVISGNNNLIGNVNKYTSLTTKSKYFDDKIRRIKTPYRHGYDLSKFKRGTRR